MINFLLVSISAVISASIFVSVSFITAGAFAMVSISAFFNLYYGIMFLILGGFFIV